MHKVSSLKRTIAMLICIVLSPSLPKLKKKYTPNEVCDLYLNIAREIEFTAHLQVKYFQNLLSVSQKLAFLQKKYH